MITKSGAGMNWRQYALSPRPRIRSRRSRRNSSTPCARALSSSLELPGLTLAPVPVESGTARFDLLLTAVEAAGGLTGDLEFNRDLFDPSTIARLLGHLRILAEGAVRQPEARLAELPLLSAPEAHQLLLAWNDTAAARPPA